MRIDCYLSEGCGAENALRQNMAEALSTEEIEAEVISHRIADEEAMVLGLSGSPSVFINGKELQLQGTVSFT